MNRVVVLQVSTWTDRLAASHHFYGELVWNPGGERKSFALLHPMTQSEALERNKKDRDEGFLQGWQVGEPTSAFWTLQELRVEAVKKYQELYPDAVLLLEGSSSSLSPQEPLHANDPELFAKLKDIWERDEAGYKSDPNWDDEGYKATQKEWDELFTPLR